MDTRGLGLYHIEKLISQRIDIVNKISKFVFLTYAHWLLDNIPILKARASTLSEFVYCKRRALLLTLLENTPEVGELQLFEMAKPEKGDYAVVKGKVLHHQGDVMSVILYDSDLKRRFGALEIYGKPDDVKEAGDMLIISEFKSKYSDITVKKALLQAYIYGFIYYPKYPYHKIVLRIKTFDNRYDEVFDYEPDLAVQAIKNIFFSFAMPKKAKMENPLRCKGCRLKNLCLRLSKVIDEFSSKYGSEKYLKYSMKLPKK